MDLDDYIGVEGPFDAIIGLSQGALLAAMYLAHRYPGAVSTSYESIKCAIFICGSPPWQVLDDGGARIFTEEIDGDVPTVQIYGSRDRNYEHSVALSDVCQKKRRRQLNHEGGHEISRSVESTVRMVSAIEETIDYALFAQ